MSEVAKDKLIEILRDLVTDGVVYEWKVEELRKLL